VLAVTVGLLITLAVALGVMFLVAFPYLRSGSRILTPDGERVVERAKEQAKQKPVAAAGTTWNGLIWVQQRVSRAWAPVSALLHEAFDRLESRQVVISETSTETGSPAGPQAPHRHAAGAGGAPAVGRPRSIPVDSGPIPEIPEVADDGAQPSHRPDPARVIDLRPGDEAEHQDDHHAGSARHAR
jgi:hypothetical protein